MVRHKKCRRGCPLSSWLVSEGNPAYISRTSDKGPVLHKTRERRVFSGCDIVNSPDDVVMLLTAQRFVFERLKQVIEPSAGVPVSRWRECESSQR